MAKSKLSLIGELFGIKTENTKRRRSRKSSNKWQREQANADKAKTMISAMTDSNPVVQVAIAKHITGLDIAPKDIAVKDPVAKMEEVVTNRLLTEPNHDENLKEKIKQGLIDKWYCGDRTPGQGIMKITTRDFIVEIIKERA